MSQLKGVNRREQADRIRSILRKVPAGKRNITEAQHALRANNIQVSDGTARGHLASLTRAAGRKTKVGGVRRGGTHAAKKLKVAAWLRANHSVSLLDAIDLIKSELGYRCTVASLAKARKRLGITTKPQLITASRSNDVGTSPTAFESTEIQRGISFIRDCGGTERAQQLMKALNGLNSVMITG